MLSYGCCEDDRLPQGRRIGAAAVLLLNRLDAYEILTSRCSLSKWTFDFTAVAVPLEQSAGLCSNICGGLMTGVTNTQF